MSKIIKKSDIKTYKNVDKKEELEELVTADGELSSGDKSLNSDSEITTGIPVTTDDHEESTMQHRSLHGYGGTAFARGARVTETRLKAIIEDIVNNKSSDKDLVSDDNDLNSKIDKFIKSINSDDLDTDEVIKLIKSKIKK